MQLRKPESLLRPRPPLFGGHHPTASRARLSYLFNTPVTLNIDVDQHTNGINCLKVTLDGKNVAVLPQRGSSQY